MLLSCSCRTTIALLSCYCRVPVVVLGTLLKQNSRGRRRQRRQNNKTNYTRQKAHVKIWCLCRPALKWDFNCSISTCLQNVADISRTFTVSSRRRWSQWNFSENRNIRGNKSEDMLSKIHGWRKPRLLEVPAFALLSCYCRVPVVFLSRYCRVTIALLSWYCRVPVVLLSRFCRDTVTFLSCYYRASVVLLSRYCRVELKLQWGKPEWYLTKNIAEAYSPIDFGTTVAGNLFFYDVALYSVVKPEMILLNRRFPSWLSPLFQSES